MDRKGVNLFFDNLFAYLLSRVLGPNPSVRPMGSMAVITGRLRWYFITGIILFITVIDVT
jgi:hypothetical protein